MLERTLAQKETIEDFRVEHAFAMLGRRILLLNARKVINPHLGSERILIAIEDITEREQAAEIQRKNFSRLLADSEELSRFNDVAVGRELRMVDLKKEVNELCRRLGEPARYPLDFEQEANGGRDS